MKGLYRQGGKQTWWYRWTVAGKQHRISTGTRDEAEAIRIAERFLREGPKDKVSAKVWEGAVEAYCVRKRKAGEFRVGTAGRVQSALLVFARDSGCSTPEAVRLSHLQDYYNKRRQKSEAGARSTLATIQAFLTDLGRLPGRVKFAVGSKSERREAVVSLEDSDQWIREAGRDDLRFVLYCGFHAGLRAGEIRHARAEWFDRSRGVLTIPAKEIQKTSKGKSILWEIKDREARSIPLSPAFRAFLGSFLGEKKEHCLNSQKSRDGLFDFRAPFEALAEKMGRNDVSPHSMRHSWISGLCNSGNHSIQEVAAWSGDTLQTIERNYWHKRTEPGALDATFSGKRKGDDIAEIKAQLSEILARDGKPTDILEEIRKLTEETRAGSAKPLTLNERLALAGRDILAREKKK